ncbi:MAG TPA: glycosyltransferase family 39 protein [Terriglobales bacterium]|nr:glycosyltransferase family 39 protein [Terriglobales bacterium]
MPWQFVRGNLIRGTALFISIFVLLVAAHWSVLRLLYFWDEAGYYIPAAYDIFTSGSFIPHSTLSNAHPPLVMLYLAAAWKLFGYTPVVTRSAMLLVAALALSGVFALAQHVANRPVAAASVLCTALYPVFFAQSSLAHLDLAAAAFTLWGIFFYLKQRRWLFLAAFTAAVLAKETAIITPIALYGWEVVRKSERIPAASWLQRAATSLWLLLPTLPLAAWFAYHRTRTGYIFGNPYFLAYNVGATLQPARMIFAFVRRVWQLVGHMNLYALTLAMGLAMFLPPQSDAGVPRNRIALPHQFAFAVIMAAHAIVFSLIGGAVLARYMLPAIPLVIIISVSTIWRRIPGWPAVIALVCGIFVAGLFINPPYVFAPEDNLAYRDYVVLHQQAAQMIDEKFPRARILTAWPAADELSKPLLGYVSTPHTILRIENFTMENLEAANQSAEFDMAVVFSSKYQPAHRLPAPEFWKRAQVRFFDDHPDTPPELAAQILGGSVIWKANRGGQWIAIIAIPQIRNAERDFRFTKYD